MRYTNTVTYLLTFFVTLNPNSNQEANVRVVFREDSRFPGVYFSPSIPFISLCLILIGKLILNKIIKIVATRYQMRWPFPVLKYHTLRLKCTQFDFRWGCAPDPAEGAYSALPVPIAGFKRAYI